MTVSQDQAGRVQQKRRTRAALLQAARELLEAGQQPSLQDVADRATISRATTYRYYSSIELLLQEAVLDGIAAQVDSLQLDSAAPKTGDLDVRIEAVVTSILDMVLSNEALFRTYLRNVVAGDDRPSRGARRIRWLADAYGADRVKFSRKLLDRMTNALSLLTGIETVIVARDVCGLDDKQIRDLVQWTARAIIRAAVLEQA